MDGARQPEFSLSLLKVGVRRHPVLCILLVALSVGAGAIVSALHEPLYLAQATILVKQTQVQILWETMPAENIKAHEALTLSQPVIARMLELAQAKDPAISYAVENLKAVAKGELLTLRVMHPKPAAAVLLANSWVAANIEEMQRRERSLTTYTRDFLGAEIVPDLRKTWMDKRNELQRFIDEKNVDEKEFEQHPVRKTYAMVSEHLHEASLRHTNLTRERRIWEEAEGDMTRLLMLPRMREHPSVKQLETLMNQSKLELLELELEFDAKSPKLARKRADLEKLRDQQKLLPKAIFAELAFDLQRVELEIKDLQAQFDKDKKEYEELKKSVYRRQVLEVEVEEARQQYEVLRKRQNEAELSGRVTYSKYQAWELADEPKSPVEPDWPRNLVGGAVAGLLLALGSACLLELLDDTVRGPAGLEAALGASVIGVIPNLGRPWRKAPYTFVLDSPSGPPLESMRILKSALAATHLDPPRDQAPPRGHVLLVTSPDEEDGKSFVAANLAHLLAFSGTRVVLLDVDARKGSLTAVFGRGEGRGLDEVLAGKATLEAALRPVPNSKAVFLPASSAGAGSEALDSPAFSKLLTTLSRAFDLVILDGSSILKVGAMSSLASKADLVLLVMRGRHTRVSHAVLAHQVLLKAGAKSCVFALNGVQALDSEM